MPLSSHLDTTSFGRLIDATLPPLLRSVHALRAGVRGMLLPMFLLLLLVSCSEDNGPVVPPDMPSITEVEARVHMLINQYRADLGLAPFALSDVITTQARNHSGNMADGSVEFSHDGFPERVKAIQKQISIAAAGENVAMNSGYTDPARRSVDSWIDSDGHRANIQGDWDLTGIGVAQSAAGGYYLTQIFVKSR